MRCASTSPASPRAKTSTTGCVSAVATRWDRCSSSTSSGSTRRCSCAKPFTRSTRTGTMRRPLCCVGWWLPAISAARPVAAFTSTDRSVGPRRGNRLGRLALDHVQGDAGKAHLLVPELRRVHTRFSEHGLQVRDCRDAHLLAGLELRALRLKLEVAGRHHELALDVDQTQLDLLRLTDVLRPEAESRDHREGGPAGKLWQV